MKDWNFIHNRVLYIIRDGSCYFSINSNDIYISYDNMHINAISQIALYEYDTDELWNVYNSMLYLPLIDD